MIFNRYSRKSERLFGQHVRKEFYIVLGMACLLSVLSTSVHWFDGWFHGSVQWAEADNTITYHLLFWNHNRVDQDWQGRIALAAAQVKVFRRMYGDPASYSDKQKSEYNALQGTYKTDLAIYNSFAGSAGSTALASDEGIMSPTPQAYLSR